MKRLLSLIGFLLLYVYSAAEEVDTMSCASSRQLDDLEVVGVKRLSAVNDGATTVIMPSEVKRLGIDALKSVSEIAPNFYMPDYGSKMTSPIYVRGLGARMDQPIIGLNVDNVAILNKDAYDFDLPDISRIVILRGARSLLNGRNTMGGQVNVYTLSPWEYSGFRTKVSYGRFNDVGVSVGYYHKWSEKIAASVSGAFERNDGYFINEYNKSDVGGQNNASLRAKICMRPNSHSSIINVAAVSYGNQHGYPYQSLSTDKIEYNDTCFYYRTMFSDGLTAVWSHDNIMVSSVSAVQYIDDNMTLDQDFTSEDYFTITQRRKEWAVSEDVFVKGRSDRYSWLSGAFAFVKSGDMNAPVTFYKTGINRLIESHWNETNPSYPIVWDDKRFVLGSRFEQSTSGFAAYHQSDYKFNERLTVSGGLRLDIEQPKLNYSSNCNTGYTIYHRNEDGSVELFKNRPVRIDDKGRLSETYVELLPKLSATYRIDEVELYGSITRAYKAGGFNTQMFSDVLQQRIMQYMGMSMSYTLEQIVSYKPEKSWNYEVGMNSSFFEGRLNLGATLFYIDCRDQQLTMFPPGMTTGRIMTNAGRTRSIGGEFTASVNLIDALTLRLNYGFTDARFRKFIDAKGDYRGNRLPYAPAQTLFASADWRMPFYVFGGKPSVGVNLRGAGDIYWDEANDYRQPFYAQLGAIMSLKYDKIDVRVWGENLTSTKYNSFYFLSMGNVFVQKGLPWRAGVALSFMF